MDNDDLTNLIEKEKKLRILIAKELRMKRSENVFRYDFLRSVPMQLVDCIDSRFTENYHTKKITNFVGAIGKNGKFITRDFGHVNYLSSNDLSNLKEIITVTSYSDYDAEVAYTFRVNENDYNKDISILSNMDNVALTTFYKHLGDSYNIIDHGVCSIQKWNDSGDRLFFINYYNVSGNCSIISSEDIAENLTLVKIKNSVVGKYTDIKNSPGAYIMLLFYKEPTGLVKYKEIVDENKNSGFYEIDYKGFSDNVLTFEACETQYSYPMLIKYNIKTQEFSYEKNIGKKKKESD